jgi:nucleoside phosphorylase
VSDSSFKVHVEPIAAGGKVIASSSSSTTELITNIASRAVAVETEGAGFLAAVQRFGDVSGIVVRGISDMCDGKSDYEDREWQPRAASRAAAFAFELLRQFAKDQAVRGQAS